MNMKVIKRNGKSENVSFDKILHRIQKLINDKKLGVLEHAQADVISQEVISRLADGITTEQLDELSANLAMSKSIYHTDYTDLASRIIISNLHKKTTECFSSIIEKLYNNKAYNEESSPLVSKELYDIVKKNKKTLNFAIDYDRDYLFSFFAIKTLERSYLFKIKGEIIERPQHLWMRVSLGIHKDNIERVIETYNCMSLGLFTHATPTLFNSGTDRPSMSSCFLLDSEDSMKGIYKCITDTALISKNAGGIGVSISDIRCKGSYIKGTNGKADGIVPMLKVFNDTARYVNQGGKRNGSFAFYLEPWHGDIFDFLNLRRNVKGDESMKCRDLFTSLWIPDIFMECVGQDSYWYLMCPNTCVGLTTTYGEEFRELYYNYVKNGKYVKKIKARELWDEILIAQVETGMPYITYKDHANRKSNQKNIGIIKSSNLCAEIFIASTTKEYGTCNIATLGLSKYVEIDSSGKYIYNFQKLLDMTKILVRNLNNIIDYNYYPVPETKISNMNHRPIAIGVQGLADVFFMMKIPFESQEATNLNLKIFETIQYAALYESNVLSKQLGSYSSFQGSPASLGIFQHNMWNIKEIDGKISGLWDWETLRKDVMESGLRNSLLTSCPPTASTSQILGNYESFEPVTNNFMSRTTLYGDCTVINRYLIKDLSDIGLWNEQMMNTILADRGSVQNIKEIPENIKKLYKTVYEIPQKVLMKLSADRGAFIDHSQSLNLYFKTAQTNSLNAAHFYGFKLGLKTSMYYCRTPIVATPQQFTVPLDVQKKIKQDKEDAVLLCSLENPGSCVSCSG